MDAMDCAAYFQKNPAYDRLLLKIWQKYKSLGHAGGSVCLPDATEEECAAARALFGRPFKAPLRLTLKDFEKELQSTAYAGITLRELLEAYFRQPLVTKRESCEEEEYEWRSMLDRVAASVSAAVCKRWIQALAQVKQNGYLLARAAPRAQAEKSLRDACRGVGWLLENRERVVRLAVWSAAAVSDPHAFDSGTLTGKLLLHLLAFWQETVPPAGAEQRNRLYYQAGVLCDSISSTVTQVGLILSEGEAEHPAYEAFRLGHEPCTLNLTNLARLTGARSSSGRVYLVENQMVFSQLCDQAHRFRAPLICTSGQPQVAVLRLLDLLEASGTRMYYSGDFDVNGLKIASRLSGRYIDLFKLWHMKPQDYLDARSERRMAPERIVLLRQFENDELAKTAAAIAQDGRVGYQEMLLPRLLDELTG